MIGVRLLAKRTLLPTLLMLCTSAHAQDQAPELVRHAIQCLAAKDFVVPTKRPQRFGYFIDETSYPGQRVIYLVNFRALGRPNGFVYAVFVTDKQGHQYFDIQNNATFVVSKDLSDVEFTNPPLGGVWTQEHLTSAIKEIERRPRMVLSARSAFSRDPSLNCEAYTDPQLGRE